MSGSNSQAPDAGFFFADASVADHLACQDQLLDRPGSDGIFAWCWTAHPALVMGKNQNPWREVNLPLARRLGLPLYRRVSGGGTVYQDPGNLSLEFCFPRGDYVAGEVYACFLEALADLGVADLRREETSLFAGPHKVSGHAFAYRRDRVLHHGTLLLHADLTHLPEVLTSRLEVAQTHAVTSRPAPVRNLVECRLPDAVAALSRAARRRWPGMRAPELRPLSVERAAHWTSHEWVLDRTPGFDLRLPDPRGHGVCGLRIVHGRVDSVTHPELQSLVGMRPLADQLGDLPVGLRRWAATIPW